MIAIVDGGPGENPRYEKTISFLLNYSVENGLDAFFLGTNAQGRSAFNRVECRMAKLRKELSDVSSNMINLGIILMQRV